MVVKPIWGFHFSRKFLSLAEPPATWSYNHLSQDDYLDRGGNWTVWWWSSLPSSSPSSSSLASSSSSLSAFLSQLKLIPAPGPTSNRPPTLKASLMWNKFSSFWGKNLESLKLTFFFCFSIFVTQDSFGKTHCFIYSNVLWAALLYFMPSNWLCRSWVRAHRRVIRLKKFDFSSVVGRPVLYKQTCCGIMARFVW